ncbi:MAG: hypothetical protein AAF611_05540 [Bacteroidota bacterium]
MGAKELRNKIIQLLETDNINYLKTVFEFAEKQKLNTDDKTIIAYTVQGEALTESEYINKIKEAEASVKAGNFTSVEDLEKEAEKW